VKRKARPLVGVSPVVALALRAEGTPSSPQVVDPSCAERPRDPQELTGAAVEALAPAIARGLGFDLQAAVRARLVRLLALHTIDGRPLPSDWAIPILPGEVVVECAALRSPLSGVAALIVRGAVLPRPKIDLPERERIALALADAVLAELKGHTT
jgi:hypothetical protein